jgi:mono/diheme cytochrome c family protein
MALLLFLAFIASIASPPPTGAHEPITTRVRFNKEVIRVLQRNCLGCHHPGGIAMSLAAYEEARPWAKAIKEELLEKRMPPWRTTKGYGEYRNAPPLTQRDIEMIVNWVEGGAPKGDAQDLPAEPLYSDDWLLSKPDLVIGQRGEQKVEADADEYREFILDTGLKQDRWLSGVNLKPGNHSVVHCATIAIARGTDRPATPASPFATILATWMPGQPPVLLNAPVAQLLPAGSKLQVRVHYKGMGEAATDRCEIGLYFSKAPSPKPLQHFAITDQAAIVPAGVGRYKVSASVTVQSELDGIGVRPMVHPLALSVQATAYRPDGTEEVLIWSRGYQLDWQQTYYFKRPVPLPKGTRIEVIVWFDNSEANRYNPSDPPKAFRMSESAMPLVTLLTATRDTNE